MGTEINKKTFLGDTKRVWFVDENGRRETTGLIKI